MLCKFKDLVLNLVERGGGNFWNDWDENYKISRMVFDIEIKFVCKKIKNIRV